MHLFITRHGMTDWNHARRFQGQSDIPLNDDGVYQSRILGEYLASEKFDHIYSSDLQRAYQTAISVAKFQQCTLEKEPRLRELNFGQWEGLTYEQIKQRDPQALTDWLEIPTDYSPPGGESLAQLAGRIQEVLEELQRKHIQGRILLVAHGGPIQVLLCLALGLPPASYWRFSIKQASINQLSFYPHGAVINGLNDICHLKNER